MPMPSIDVAGDHTKAPPRWAVLQRHVFAVQTNHFGSHRPDAGAYAIGVGADGLFLGAELLEVLLQLQLDILVGDDHPVGLIDRLLHDLLFLGKNLLTFLVLRETQSNSPKDGSRGRP